MEKRIQFKSINLIRSGLLTAFAFSLSISLHAQTAPVKRWDKTFGGTGSDVLRSLQQTSDGGYILGGSSYSPISGDKSQASKGSGDFWVVKLDASNNKLWDKTIGGSGDENLMSLKQTTDGGYILGGYSNSPLSGDKSENSKGNIDYWIVKLDANGNKAWDKTIGGNGYDLLYSVQQTSDGGFILGGHSMSPLSGDKSQNTYGGHDDYWLVKLDASGNKVWDKTIGGYDLDYLSSLQQTTDGGYIMGGRSESGLGADKSEVSRGTDDFWVVKLDANGNKTWDKTIGGSMYDELFSLQQTTDGGYLLGGASQSGISGDKSQASKGSSDFWIIKLDAGGNKTWDKTFGGIGYDEIHFLQQTTDGGYILGGVSESPVSGDKSEASRGGNDYWVVKVDASGNKIWDKTIGGSGNEGLNSLQQTSDGGYILGGYSYSSISGDKSQASKGDSDFWVVKLGGNATGVKEIEAAFPVSIFPNPNNGRFNLQLSNLTVPDVEVTISDMLGRVVLQQDLKVAGQQIFQELALPAAKGIYLLQLKAGEQNFVRKIIVE